MKQIGQIIRPKHYDAYERTVEADAKTNEAESIANLVFATDPRTGLPADDIGVYMSDKTHPDIKRYIEENLFAEISPTNQIKSDMQDDKAIMDAMPQKGETLNQYEARIQAFLDKEKESRATKKFEKELQEKVKAIKEKDNPVPSE